MSQVGEVCLKMCMNNRKINQSHSKGNGMYLGYDSY